MLCWAGPSSSWWSRFSASTRSATVSRRRNCRSRSSSSPRPSPSPNSRRSRRRSWASDRCSHPTQSRSTTTATARTRTSVERVWASRGIRGGAYGVGYPRPPVAKKHRVRARSRRAVEASRRASAARPPAPEREPSLPAATSRTTRYGSRTGTSRAVGAPAQGTVTRLLADDTGPSGTHQRFIMQVSGSSQTLLIDNNVDIGKRVPVATGDGVTIHGEYVWNDQGGLVHFTHHDPVHTHEDGW